MDLKQAYDSVWREGLWEVLRVRGVRPKLLRLIKALYRDTSCAVRSEGGLGKWFKVGTGLRQGCVLSPLLFNVFFDYVIRRAVEVSRNDTVDNTGISHLEYADDLVFLAPSFEVLTRQLERLVAECRRWGLTVNAAKTKVMTAERGNNNYPDMFSEGVEVERVEGFTYLGHWMDSNGSIESEINIRINKASRSWAALSRAFMSRELSSRTKSKLFRSVIIPTLTYGAETWPASDGLLKKLDVFQSRCLRRIWRINWWDHVRNEDVLRMARQKPVSCTIKENRLQWLGKILRMDDNRIPRRIYEWTPSGTRPRGRPRSRWTDLVKRDLRECGVQSIEEAELEAQDRRAWQRLVHGPMRLPL